MAIRIKNQKFYRTEDLVDMLPLKLPSIQNYIRKGKIHAVKIGLFWYISEANLNLFLRGGYELDKKQPG
ncbi:hypothetical protein ES705_22631 [subsurface metagenome]